MTRLRLLGRDTFSALRIPNYRRYYVGQAVSMTGTWMQMIAQSWLVLQLTHSSVQLGVIVALQALPVLLLGPYGGVIADRVNKRRLMVVLQSLMGIQALVLGILTVTGNIRVWEIAVLAGLLGVNTAFENPVRQSFMMELVGADELRNAISLNTVLVNVARSVGPAVAGIVIAVAGEGVCFLANAGSFVFVVASLVTMDAAALRPSRPTERKPRQLREGLTYVASNELLFVPLLMMGLTGMLTYEFQVTLPTLAKTLGGGAGTYGLMMTAMGAGAVVGGLATAARGRTGLRALVQAATVFGVLLLGVSLAPTTTVAFVLLVLAGAASVAFIAMCNSTLQLNSAPAMRGRVMALWFVGFQGSTPIGGPVIGVVIAATGARAGLAVGGATCLVAALIGLRLCRRAQARSSAAVAEPTPDEAITAAA
jgi:MFS family permease